MHEQRLEEIRKQYVRDHVYESNGEAADKLFADFGIMPKLRGAFGVHAPDFRDYVPFSEMELTPTRGKR